MKYIITESQKDTLLINSIKEYGIDYTSNMVGGIDALINFLNIKSPIEFLYLYNDLNVVKSEDRPEIMLFRYQKGKNLMTFNTDRSNIVSVNDKIWSILENEFELGDDEIREVIGEWLYEVYGISGTRILRYRHRYLMKLT